MTMNQLPHAPGAGTSAPGGDPGGKQPAAADGPDLVLGATANSGYPLLTVTVESEHDVFALRRQAKVAADSAGLDPRDQVRMATALSELGRDLLRPTPMTAVFLLVRQEPNVLAVRLHWPDDRVPSQESLAAVTRLLPQTVYGPAVDLDQHAGTDHGGHITVELPLPPDTVKPEERSEHIRTSLLAVVPADPVSPVDELRSQTRDLLAALEESRTQRVELERLNQELQETNQGVIALYTELTAGLQEANRGLEVRYNDEHQLALTLQRTFLPEHLPHWTGGDLAVRYLAAMDQSEIGGDFYEALHTPQGLLLAVGDVAGHSLQAAIVMGQLRHALRAYAAEGHSPAVLVELLDRLLVLHHPTWTATLCIILVEPDGRGIHVANAGHLPPLVMPPHENPFYVQEHGPLLGVNLPHPPSTYTAVAPGTRLLMITDGLIEVRGTDLGERLTDLSRAAHAGPVDCESLCDALLDEYATDQKDDIIVLTALFGESGQ
jgi:serine phosphatase RsbU (regulator of sigma subunit)